MILGGGDTVGKLRFELSRLATLDPFQVLDLKPDSDGPAVRAAFLAATKRYHPNRFARDSVETRDAATEVFLVIRRAYSLLGDETKRRVWRERLTSPTAGERTPPPEPVAIPMPPQPAEPKPVAQARPPATEPPRRPLPRPAARPRTVAAAPRPAPQPPPSNSITGRSPDEVRALLEEARTRSMRFEQASKLMADGQHGEARVIMQKLAAEDPQNRKYRIRLHHAWGLEHLNGGRFLDAVRELERATSLEPESNDIARALGAAKEKRDASRGGVFSKFFGR